MKDLIRLDSAAVYPYSDELHSQYECESAFGDNYNLSLKVGDELFVPRNLDYDKFPQSESGDSVEFLNNFKPLHDEQQSVVDQASNLCLTFGASFIIQADCGYGKTYIGCALAANVGKKTLIITTKQDIIDQWVEAAEAVLGLDKKDIGVWQGNKCTTDKTFVVGLVQSIFKGPERYGQEAYEGYGLVVVDEVHRVGADQFVKAMWWLKAALRVGLSATPKRKDGKTKVLDAHIGPVSVVGTVPSNPVKIIRMESEFKLPRVTNEEGDEVPLHHEAGRTMHIFKMMGKWDSRNALIVNFCVKALSKGRHIVVFSDLTDHLDLLHKLLRKAGVANKSLGYYVGLTNKVYAGNQENRKAMREEVKKLPLILATYKMFSEATNIPRLDTAILGMPKSDVEQIIGRIQRDHPDKKEAVALDIVDNDSYVFRAYAKKRNRFYKSKDFKVVG